MRCVLWSVDGVFNAEFYVAGGFWVFYFFIFFGVRKHTQPQVLIHKTKHKKPLEVYKTFDCNYIDLNYCVRCVLWRVDGVFNAEIYVAGGFWVFYFFIFFWGEKTNSTQVLIHKTKHEKPLEVYNTLDCNYIDLNYCMWCVLWRVDGVFNAEIYVAGGFWVFYFFIFFGMRKHTQPQLLIHKTKHEKPLEYSKKKKRNLSPSLSFTALSSLFPGSLCSSILSLLLPLFYPLPSLPHKKLL